MAKKKNSASNLTYRKGKGYTRDLGWKLDEKGKRRQHRFLLGHDEASATLANARLEALWAIIVKDAETKSNRLTESYLSWSPDSMAGQEADPLWDEQTMLIAKAVAKGQSTIPFHTQNLLEHQHTGGEYAAQIHYLQEKYKGIIAFTPVDAEAFAKSQSQHKQIADHRARQARLNAAIAHTPIPDTGVNQSLYQAINAYSEYCKQNKKAGANEPKDALSLKAGIPDLTLDQFGYDAILRLGDYWRSRPTTSNRSKRGQPLAINTVDNRLKTTRRFIRWLHRSDAWQWRSPEDWEEALRFNKRQLLSETELLKSADGPETWTDEELVTLYRYATDHERCLFLMGLNLGFAQSELISFNKDALKLEDDPPHIRRVRRKTGKLFQAALWPETVNALKWLQAELQDIEPANNPWVLLTEKGNRPDRQRISNTWNKLLDRIQQDVPDFRRLPFKHLRKTAYQLVLEASSSHEVAGAFQGRSKLSSDEYADSYGRRLFDRVFEANLAVHKRLTPMFDAAPNAFTEPRTKGGPNLSRARIAKIKRLHNEGLSSAEIAKKVGVSKPTVYRWINRTQADKALAGTT